MFRTRKPAVLAVGVLPEVVEATGGQIEVLVDGGIRSGADLLRALVLGERAVPIGCAPRWGLKLGGTDWVARVIELLREALEIAGASTLAEIGPAMPTQPIPGAGSVTDTRVTDELWLS